MVKPWNKDDLFQPKEKLVIKNYVEGCSCPTCIRNREKESESNQD